jgi:hypothetical protein
MTLEGKPSTETHPNKLKYLAIKDLYVIISLNVINNVVMNMKPITIGFIMILLV